MAVANPYLRKDCEKWKREMEENGRRRWRERVSCWVDADVRDEEDEDVKGEEDVVSNKEDGSVEGEENEEEKRDEATKEDTDKGGRSPKRSQKKKEGGEIPAGDQRGDVEEEEYEEELDVKENEEVWEGKEDWMDDREKFDADEEGENDSDTKSEAEGNQMEMMEEMQFQEEDDDAKEHPEQPRRSHREEELTKQRSSSQVENIWQNQESRSHLPPVAEYSADEDEEEDDEVMTCCKDDYPVNIFLTLSEFRDSSLLTDLTLQTADGLSFHVHSPVLAAVSTLIWRNLSSSKVEHSGTNAKICTDISAGVRVWSVSVGPEVDRVGLEAIVEFAYSGLIPGLNKHNLEQIKVAAETLEVTRVLDLCTKEAEWLACSAGNKEKEKTSAAQQLMINLQSIKQLWVDREGCDVILETLSGSLHVHRVILAASSDYFRSMFTLGMKECNQPCVSLPFLCVSELEALVGSSYNGALSLNWTCVFEITSTALQLQYQPALSLCLNFLQQEINPHTCLDVVSFAEAYQMTHLLEVAEDFVLRQFQKVAGTSKFKDLPSQQLFKYLNSRSLCVPTELVVFNAVVAWIQAKPKRRLILAKKLMKTVYFPLMTFKEFKEVQSENMWADPSLAELYEAIVEDFCSSEIAPQKQCRIYLPKESLVLTGGDQISEELSSRSISRDLWFGNSLRNHTGVQKAVEWRRLGEMPEPARFSHEAAVLNGQLYVFGGKSYYGLGDSLNSVYRYDHLQNSWEILKEMQERRSAFSVVVLDGKIYAIGGHCDPDYIDTVECYSPSTNSWRSSQGLEIMSTSKNCLTLKVINSSNKCSPLEKNKTFLLFNFEFSFTWPLDLPLGGHVAKVIQGQIFISGGQNNDYLCLASMILYRPGTGSTYMANMTTARAYHCMETLAECLYVAGGSTTQDNVTVSDLLACEVYNPAVDSWTAFTPLPVPHVGAGSAVLEGKFYVLGGYSQEDYSDTKMVHRYDAATQKWENMGTMPGPNNDLRACLLCLPQHFRL